jgi:hypothetical protein
MSLRLRLAEVWLPGPVRKKYFRELAERTARAFEVPPPDLAGLAAEEARRLFARFSHACASGLAADAAARTLAEQRLRAEAMALGRRLASALGVRTRSEVLRAARLLYGSIQIDFRGDERGRIHISGCSFADVYSPATCRTIAALDEGLLVGLAGGGTLTFSARLTEGAPACLARFDFPETIG